MNDAALVGRAGAVRVAVEQQAQVVAAAGEDAERLVDVRPDRLRVDAAEVRVALLVDLGDPDLARRPAAAGSSPRRRPTSARRGRAMSAAFSASRSSVRRRNCS